MKALRDTITAIFIGGVLLAILGSSSSTPMDAPAAYQLKAEPYHCNKLGDSYIVCEGRVTNISGTSLSGVEALAQCLAADGSFVTANTHMLEYNPILSGQTSPYHINIDFSAAIAQCTVSFKHASGQPIPAE